MLFPKDSGDSNERTLSELQRTFVDLDGKGKVVVMGDFNSRVGEIPNTISSRWSDEATMSSPRKSVDKKLNGAGRVIMEGLNAVGLVLL